MTNYGNNGERQEVEFVITIKTNPLGKEQLNL